MLVSFRGLFHWAEKTLMNQESVGDAVVCINTSHDVILGLIKGDATIDEVRDFMFSGMSKEEIEAIPYKEAVIFDKKDRKI